MKLTVKAINSAKPESKPYKLFDGGGLYLQVTPTGRKYWRLKYRIGGREKTLSIGVYPGVTLAEARAACRDAKSKLDDGLDPSADKRKNKIRTQGMLFEDIANEWYTRRVSTWSPGYSRQLKSAFERYIYPRFSDTPINAIKPLRLLEVLSDVEKTAPTTASKLRQWCGEVFTYAIITGRAEVNPAAGLNTAMKRQEPSHFAHLEEHEISEFLSALELIRYATEKTYLAIRLLMIVGLRPGELVGAPWSEIDFDREVWNIPKERMKKRRPHIVPLS